MDIEPVEPAAVAGSAPGDRRVPTPSALRGGPRLRFALAVHPAESWGGPLAFRARSPTAKRPCPRHAASQGVLGTRCCRSCSRREGPRRNPIEREHRLHLFGELHSRYHSAAASGTGRSSAERRREARRRAVGRQLGSAWIFDERQETIWDRLPPCSTRLGFLRYPPICLSPTYSSRYETPRSSE